MKKIIFLTIAIVLIFFFIISSFFKINEGFFAISGKKIYAKKGIKFKPFYKKVYLYKEKNVYEKKINLLTKEGARKEVNFYIDFEWEKEKLIEKNIKEKEILNYFENLKEWSQDLKEKILKDLSFYPIKINELYLEEEGIPKEIKEKLSLTGKKVIFFGLDGLDWILIKKLLKDGKLKNLSNFIKNGAYGDLISIKPLLSPIVWTTISTSQLPEKHGILDFVVKDKETGKDMPITSNHRKVPAFWNILSAFNLKVNVIGFWATYPAEEINGILITERPFFHLFGMEGKINDPLNYYPGEAKKILEENMVKVKDIDYFKIKRFLNISEREFNKKWEECIKKENPYEDPVCHMRKIIAITESNLNIVKKLIKENFDLFAFYIEGTDTVAHRFAHCIPPKLSWVSEEEYSLGKNALENYYIYIDEKIGEIKEIAPEEAIWIIASDHGFYVGEDRPSARPDDFTTGAPEWHRITGVLIIYGKEVKNIEVKGASILDIVPTIFYILGIPLSKEFEGKPLKECFLFQNEIKEIASYDFIPKKWQKKKKIVMDEEMIKELKALGYISGEEEKNFIKYYNLANVYYEEGKIDLAMEYYKKAIEEKKDFSLGHFALAQCYAKKGDHLSSYEHLKKAFFDPKELPVKAVYHLAEEAILCKKEEEAYIFLKNLQERYKNESSLYLAYALLENSTGKKESALKYLEKAHILSPSHPVVCEELLKLYIERKDFEKAKKLLKETWEAAEGSIKTLNALAGAMLRVGYGDMAEIILKKILNSDPNNGNILSNLAIALQMQKKYKEALYYYEKAIIYQPGNPQIFYNYGSCLAEIGREKEALNCFLKALNLGMNTPKLNNALAKIYFRIGEIEKSKEYLKKSLLLDPAQEDVKEMLNSIERR